MHEVLELNPTGQTNELKAASVTGQIRVVPGIVTMALHLAGNERLKTGQYKFKVNFFGNKLTNQKNSADYATMVRTANMPAQKLFAYEGYEPFEVVSTLLLENHIGLKDMMKPIVSAFNSSSEDVGAKEKNDITESGEATRDYESNED